MINELIERRDLSAPNISNYKHFYLKLLLWQKKKNKAKWKKKWTKDTTGVHRSYLE